MKKELKLLSICIPTYNGAKYIEKNIDTIIEQIEKYNLTELEVIVSDNCSTDRIPEIMQQYAQKYPHIIRYSRNSENLGYDGNVIKCCTLAEGRFIHLFGDDDFYAPDGLLRLYNMLSNNPDLAISVLSNSFLKNNYYHEIVNRKHLNEKFVLEDKKYINDSDAFIMDVEDRAWPNTNLVFRKEYYEEIPNLLHYAKDWLHIYILLYIAQKHQYCYLFADKYPIVIDRTGVQKWLNNVDGPRIYFNNLWTYSFADVLGYSPNVFEWYRRKLLSEYIKNIVFRRSKNLLCNIKYLKKYFRYYKDIPAFYFLFIPKMLFHGTMHDIFSIENKYYRSRKIKEKICRLFFTNYRIYVKRVQKEFILPENIEFYNKNGESVQVVPSSFLDQFIDYIYENNLDKKYRKFYRYLFLARKQHYVYYSTFLKFAEKIKYIQKNTNKSLLFKPYLDKVLLKTKIC